jgi:hypothetical protein
LIGTAALEDRLRRSVAFGFAEPPIVAFGFAEPPIVAFGFAEPPIVALGFAEPPIVAFGFAETPIVAFGFAETPIVAFGLPRAGGCTERSRGHPSCHRNKTINVLTVLNRVNR